MLKMVTAELDIDADVVGTMLIMSSMRKTHPLGASWELLLDPATFAFLMGGVGFLIVRSWGRARASLRWEALPRQIGLLALAVILWLPVRVGIHLALYLHRVLRTDFDTPLSVMNQFWSNWFQVVLLIGPALLAWRISQLNAAIVEPAEMAGVPEYLLPPMGGSWIWRIWGRGLAGLAAGA